MPCRHVRIKGKKFRLIKPKRLKRLPSGTRFLIPSGGKIMRRRKRRSRGRVRVHGFIRHGRRVRGYTRRKGHRRRRR